MAAFLVLAYWQLSAPKVLRVGVPVRTDPSTRVVTALARTLDEQKADVRLKVVFHPSIAEASRALQQGQVDLAVVRPDVFLPSNGLTVAVLREEALIVLAQAREVSELVDQRIGVVTNHESDLQLVRNVLAFHDLVEPAIKLVALRPEAALQALGAKQVDALATMVAPGPAASSFVTAARRVTARELEVISLPESLGMTSDSPAFSEMKLEPGTVSSRPRLPADEVKTTGITYRLMASSETDRGPVSDLTEQLFQMRSRISKTEPLINLMKAPDTESATVAPLPNHPGAVDYFEREQQTFMDRYGDWLWLGLFFAGSMSSAVAWAVQAVTKRRREKEDQVIEELLEISARVDGARDRIELDALSRQVRLIVAHALRTSRSVHADTRTMTALVLAVDAVNSAIEDRRRTLVTEALSVDGVQIAKSM
jgi:TRAP-type uncharacterized transport system substrate-binding protein